MGGKKNKKSQSKKQGNGDKKGKGSKKSSVKKSGESKSSKSSKSRINVDIFTEHCMENAYYICHNVQDVLKCRGFPWPELANKKKKGKKGK